MYTAERCAGDAPQAARGGGHLASRDTATISGTASRSHVDDDRHRRRVAVRLVPRRQRLVGRRRRRGRAVQAAQAGTLRVHTVVRDARRWRCGRLPAAGAYLDCHRARRQVS